MDYCVLNYWSLVRNITILFNILSLFNIYYRRGISYATKRQNNTRQI
jgi:hypothetical protein